MKKYSVKFLEPSSLPQIAEWHLETPKDNTNGTTATRLQGWIVPLNPQHPIFIEVIEDGKVTFSGSSDTPRPDVMQHRSDDSPPVNDAIGFDIAIQEATQKVELVFCSSDTRSTVTSIEIAKIFKVQIGRDGHLFLDNDLNASIDQFTGKRLLDAHEIKLWLSFFDDLASLNSDNLSARLMICPAKEEVFPEHYPHPRATITPIDQLLGIATPNLTLFPLGALSAERDRAMSTIDTHWSHYGACIGATIYLKQIGLGEFAKYLPDKFFDRICTGDLGAKLPIPQNGIYVTFEASVYPRPVYENGVINHGMIRVYERPGAPVQETLVVFGDSYSMSMVPALSMVFSRICYIYSAACVSPFIMEIEKPRYVLCQTNQRFVFLPPMMNYDLKQTIAAKRSQIHPFMTPPEKTFGQNTAYSELMASIMA